METVSGNHRFTALLVSRRWLAPNILELSLNRPAERTFIPGQFYRFLMDGYQRDYTMVSHPDAETVDFCISLVEGGRFSKTLRQARAGDAFHLSGPHGHFIYQGPVNPAVFIATGTGIAPFVAFCRSGVTDALLLHGVSESGQLVYRHLLQSRLRGYIPCISQPDPHLPGEGIFSGRVTRYLETSLQSGTYDFYLCGRRGMIRDATALIDTDFGDSRIFIESYD